MTISDIFKPYKIKQFFKMRRLLGKYGQRSVIEYFQEQTEGADTRIGENCPIWCCWWQGEKNMPEIVSACYKSLLRNCGNHPVILITDENKDKYLHLPEFITEKYKQEIISRTHYSDVARMYLLKEYGGIWVDATVFFTQNIDNIVDTNLPFWSYRHHTKTHNVSCGLWTSYFIASGKNDIVTTYLYASLTNWWKNNNKIIDYLLTDYIFKAGYDNLPSVRSLIDKLPVLVNSTLVKRLNSGYNEDEWNKICRDNDFHKLTWKKRMTRETANGEHTFYSKLFT